MITKEAALLNSVPEGAYVVNVVSGSHADGAGIKPEDIITKLDGEKVDNKSGGLAKLISTKKAGDSISLDVWRDGETLNLQVTLSEFSN